MANEAADRGSTGARGDRLEAALLEHFGLPSFRDHQREAIEAVMEGRDLLLTMPTGAGKSLVHQLPAELPDFVGTEDKLRSDLSGLLSMVRFASSSEECRRAGIARHFGLPIPEEPCGACDACADPAAWLSAGLHPRPARMPEAVREAPEPGEAPFERGDWVRVGRRLGQVVRVEGSGRRLRLVVEDAADLRRRTIDPRRKRVIKLEAGGGPG